MLNNIIISLLFFLALANLLLSQTDTTINTQEVLIGTTADSTNNTQMFLLEVPPESTNTTQEELLGTTLDSTNTTQEVLLGTISDKQLSLYIEEYHFQKAISEELSDSIFIEIMIIQKDFDGSLFLYIEGNFNSKRIVLRIRLFRKNDTELYLTNKSYMEYCLASKKCKTPAFADLVGCKCLGGSSKNVNYYKIENLNHLIGSICMQFGDED